MIESPVPPIGPMKPWACSYTRGGERFAITLYGTSAEQVLEDHCADLAELSVDGELVSVLRPAPPNPEEGETP